MAKYVNMHLSLKHNLHSLVHGGNLRYRYMSEEQRTLLHDEIFYEYTLRIKIQQTVQRLNDYNFMEYFGPCMSQLRWSGTG